MQTRSRSTLVLTLLFGCATGATAASVVVPPARGEPAAARWDYTCAAIPAAPALTVEKTKEERAAYATQLLKRFAAEGWELVALEQNEMSIACFKRAL